MRRRDRARRVGQFRRAEVPRRRVHQIADEGDRPGQVYRRVDPGRLARQQHARADRIGRLTIAIEAMLGEQPAERGLARPLAGQAVGRVRQLARERGQVPRPEGLAGAGDDAPAAIGLGQDQVRVRLCFERRGRDQRAGGGGQAGEQRWKLFLADEADRVRGLAAIGAEEGGEVGHAPALQGNGHGDSPKGDGSEAEWGCNRPPAERVRKRAGV